MTCKVENHLHRHGERCIALFEFQERTYQLTCEPCPREEDEYDTDDDEPPPLVPLAAATRSDSEPPILLQNPPPYRVQASTEYATQGRTVLPRIVTVSEMTENESGDNAAKAYIDMDPGPGARTVANLIPSSIPNSYTWNDASGQPRLIVERQGRGLAIVRGARRVSHNPYRTSVDHSLVCRTTSFTFLGTCDSLSRRELSTLVRSSSTVCLTSLENVAFHSQLSASSVPRS